MKLKALDFWPPQEWKADTQTLAAEDALDATDVSASIPLHSFDVLALTVIHNNQTYAARVRVPEKFSQAVGARDQRRETEQKPTRNRRAGNRIRSAAATAYR
jgi:hypothetical protein